MKVARTLLSAAIYTSAILGIQILLMDKWLWSDAPTHALGLVVFVGIDAVLLAAIWKETFLGTIGAAFAATGQLAAMLGDVAFGHPMDISGVAFRGYLLSDTAFISLVVTQAIILLLAFAELFLPLADGHRLVLHHARGR